jgi:hypothetical protein
MNLPPELRLLIYSYVFHPTTHRRLVNITDARQVGLQVTRCAGLLTTCKTIYHEAIGMYEDSTLSRFSLAPVLSQLPFEGWR